LTLLLSGLLVGLLDGFVLVLAFGYELLKRFVV
jgi:hypothetical protein